MLIDLREKKGGRERERERNINVRDKHWSVASCMHPDPKLNLQPRYVSWPEIEPMTFWFTNDAPTSWATLARALQSFRECSCPDWVGFALYGQLCMNFFADGNFGQMHQKGFFRVKDLNAYNMNACFGILIWPVWWLVLPLLGWLQLLNQNLI